MSNSKPLFKPLVSVILASVLLFNQTAGAQYNQFYMDNSLSDYDPTFRLPTSNASCGLVGGDNLEMVFNDMLRRGLTPILAAAVTGNIAVESAGAEDPLIVERHPNINLDIPKSTNDPESLPVVGGWPGGQTRQPGWGLIQWTPAGKFVNFAEDLNLSKPYELGAQLDVIWWHLEDTTPTGRSNFLERFKTYDELNEATEVFMTDFLAPHQNYSHLDSRIAAARSVLDLHGDNLPSEGACISSDLNGIAELALEYTWPEARNNPRNNEAYAKATAEAQSKGEYIGPTDMPGIDCHAFVTRVIRNSGADPVYNENFGGIPGMVQYMSSSPKYEEQFPETENDLRRGDIVVIYGGGEIGSANRHIYLYVGENDKLQGDHSTVAEANWRISAPRSGWAPPMRENHRYFRIV